MITFDNLTKSFHKHLYENVNPTYYVHFSKLSIGENFTFKLWVQPIWYNVPIFPFCPNILKMTLVCHSVIDEDPLLTKLRKMADYCTKIYSPDPYDSNKVSIFDWVGVNLENLTDFEPIATAETFVKDFVELPVRAYDSVAVINININILLCCY
jgi:hypothetical protein